MSLRLNVRQKGFFNKGWVLSPYLLLLVSLILVAPPACRAFTSLTATQSWRIKYISRFSTSDNSDLLERARRLRQEASELEANLRKVPYVANATRPCKAVSYASINDSTWNITYRFTDRPGPAQKKKDGQDESQGTVYSGRMTLSFRRDGYTDLLSQELRGTFGASPQTSGSKRPPIKIQKAWGWDIENSQDSQEYLLFSVDVSASGDTPRKLYFQARQSRTLDSSIKFDDGTITVKQDVVVDRGIPFFGFLSPKGILAQFARVGDFIMTPIVREIEV